MAIRLSGMNSNLDTESIVKSLVSAYSVSKDNMVKAQTKLSWKKDAWKTLNSKIYSFYSKNLSNMKLSASYSKKTSTIADSKIAKVTASNSAVSGTQSLSVDKLASSGYLTGGTVASTSGSDVTSATKLSEISGLSSFASGSIDIKVGTKTTTVDMTDTTTISGLVSKLKDAGVNASFDENNNRFFISAKTSGASNDFSITAGDTGGLTAIKSLGIFTVNATDTAEYTKWANYTTDELNAIKTAAYDAAKTDFTKVSASYKSIYDKANADITTLTATNATLTEELNNALLTTEDKAAIQAKIDANTATIGTHQQTMADNLPYVILDSDDEATKTTKTSNINTAVADQNTIIQTNVNADIDAKVAVATAALAATGATDAVRKVGADSEITLNGAKFTSNTNNFSINGLTIQALSKSEVDTPTTITTDTDVDGIYNMIKDFFKGYNELINGMDAAFNATSAKGYEPLTTEEKDAMSDTEVDNWEKKVKDALLRKDTTLSGLTNALKTDMLGSFKVNGKDTSLATYGINTLGYFTAPENEKGAYHINGNPDDTDTSGNTDKLRAAIASDPESVVSFFTQLTSSVYTDLTNRMKSSSLRSAYTVYNDKQIGKEYSEYTTKIADQEDKVSELEDYYYKKFTAMETALSKLNSNSSSLTSMLG